MAPGTPPKRLLLVDDDPTVRRALAATLRRLGWEVTVVEEPRAALRAIMDGRSFEVLLTDHQMPDMLGTELAEAVRAIAPGIWIVLCSGTIELSDEELARHGIDAMLKKPVYVAALQAALFRRRV